MISRFAMMACGALLFSLGQMVSADAASLSGVQGEVWVDAGQGLKPAKSAANLKTGDTVIAQKGSAKVTYPDGCTVNVDPGASVAITAKSPCAASVQTGQIVAPGAAGLSTTALVVGGLVIAGGAAVAVSQKKDHKHSASP